MFTLGKCREGEENQKNKQKRAFCLATEIKALATITGVAQQNLTELQVCAHTAPGRQ